MKVISWNLLRLEGAVVKDVAALLERERPDVLLMQEVTQHMDVLDRLRRRALPPVAMAGAASMGLACWSRHNFATPQIPPLPASSLPGRPPAPAARSQIVQVGEDRLRQRPPVARPAR